MQAAYKMLSAAQSQLLARKKAKADLTISITEAATTREARIKFLENSIKTILQPSINTANKAKSFALELEAQKKEELQAAQDAESLDVQRCAKTAARYAKEIDELKHATRGIREL